MRQSYFTEKVRDEVLRRVAPTPQLIVAEIGCGTGFLAEAFVPRVGEVHCVDVSAGILDEARKHLAAYPSTRFHRADGSSLPLPTGSVDAAVTNMYLHHTADPAAAIRELARILRPGERLVLTDMNAHDETWMRAELADVWLGFARSDVQGWLTEAGLASAEVDCVGQECRADRPTGGRAAISVFVASGQTLA